MVIRLHQTNGQALLARMFKELQIGELASLFGLAPHVLRYWETVGLLTPAVRVNGRRVYREPHVKRVVVIMCAQEAGLSLTDLREILEARSVAARRATLARHRATLVQTVAELETSTRMVEQMLSCSDPDFNNCPVFERALESVSKPAARAPDRPTRGRTIGRLAAHGTTPRRTLTR
jgi:MerR family transcriptional regulator, copper efflux regulator